MRTLILMLVAFILILALQTCNHENSNSNLISPGKLTNDTLKDDPLDCCCNNINPNTWSCDNCQVWTLTTTCGSIYINCKCCKQIYWYYGNPESLLLAGITPPCDLVGTQVCIPSWGE